MATTIGKQWRGSPQDYAALCDYCDVRYLRSQLRRQGNGRLACHGPGTNSCGAGRDEVSLDKINADIMRHRRRPTKHQGGRFDRLRTSMEDIFGAALLEYWDAAKGVVSTSEGALVSWTGQKLGMSFEPAFGTCRALWHASRPEFGGRPGIEVTVESFATPPVPMVPLGALPYVGIVAHLPFSALNGGAVQFSNDVEVGAQLAHSRQDLDHNIQWTSAHYRSIAAPLGVDFTIPQDQIGSRWEAQLYAIDATNAIPSGLMAFRAGDGVDLRGTSSPVHRPWDRAVIHFDTTVTFIVVADRPTPAQVAEFEALGRSYAVRLP